MNNAQVLQEFLTKCSAIWYAISLALGEHAVKFSEGSDEYNLVYKITNDLRNINNRLHLHIHSITKL